VSRLNGHPSIGGPVITVTQKVGKRSAADPVGRTVRRRPCGGAPRAAERYKAWVRLRVQAAANCRRSMQAAGRQPQGTQTPKPEGKLMTFKLVSIAVPLMRVAIKGE
jgi:hypothetical protein